MDPKPSFPANKSSEEITEEKIESVENSTFEIETKIELILLLLDRKKGVQIGNFQIAESEKEKVVNEFRQELMYTVEFLKSLNLPYEIVKKLEDDNGIIGFSILTSKNIKTLNKFVRAEYEKDDKAFGHILGYPDTAVETYNTNQAFNIEEELPPDELKKLKTEGVLPFLLFMPSREHWAEELEWAKENQRLIKERAPKLYNELMNKK